jgi:chemotaxis response regulator CheB
LTLNSLVRVALGGAPTRVRLHLRRLLREESGVTIVGHARSEAELSQLAGRETIDVLLLDAAEDSAALDLLQAAGSRHIPTVVLVGEHPLPRLLASRPVVLRRPAALEAEPHSSPFTLALQEAVRRAGKAVPRRPPPAPVAPGPAARPLLLPPRVIAIGSSTGGPQALPEVLGHLAGRVRQPIVITQHMPAAFTQVLANLLERQTKVPTVQAEEGMPVREGRVHLAPGGRHLLMAHENGQVVCRINDGPAENFCKPAVDPMLRSVVDVYGSRALAVILTGMGQDGLLGCRALVEAGGAVLAQDEASSVVWGMPGAVAKAGLCQAVLPLDRLAEKIIACAGGGA